MQRRTKLISNIDWWTILLYLGLCIFGWINISGASYSYDHPSLIDFSTVAGKQLIWLGGALLLGGIILLLDHKIYDTAAYFAYAAVLVLLIITRFFPPVKGSYSWISFSSSFRLQPAEFAKLTTALALAKFMGQYDDRLRSWRDLVKPLIILGIPAMIIMVWENETGSALVFAAFMLVFYRQGMSGYVLLCGIAAVALFILAVKYSDVPIPIGTGTVGMLSCMLLLLATGIFFVLQENRYRIAMGMVKITPVADEVEEPVEEAPVDESEEDTTEVPADETAAEEAPEEPVEDTKEVSIEDTKEVPAEVEKAEPETEVYDTKDVAPADEKKPAKKGKK